MELFIQAQERHSDFKNTLRSSVKVIARRTAHVTNSVAEQHSRDFTLSRRSAGGGPARLCPPFAALFPGGGVGEEVLFTSLNSFLNGYNAILVGRLILTWHDGNEEESELL